MSALEIQQLALDVYNNKLNYKDNDFICIMALLKESYMRVKGFLGEEENEKVAEGTNDEEEECVSRYANYDSEDDSDSESYTSFYLDPY